MIPLLLTQGQILESMTNAVDKPTSPLSHENNTSQLLDINKVSEHPGKEALKDIAFGSVGYWFLFGVYVLTPRS